MNHCTDPDGEEYCHAENTTITHCLDAETKLCVVLLAGAKEQVSKGHEIVCDYDKLYCYVDAGHGSQE